MTKETREERAHRVLSRSIGQLEKLTAEMWRNGLAEAVIDVVGRTGQLSVASLIEELEVQAANPPTQIKGKPGLKITSRTSEVAIENLRKALAQAPDGLPDQK